MTTPMAPPHLRRRGNLPSSDSAKARLFLTLACVWPLLIMMFFIANEQVPAGGNDNEQRRIVNPGFQFRKFLDRVDVMGYGPTHPRVAVVVVGDDRAKILASVESIFRNTDIDRLFVVCAVMDGVESDPALVKELAAIDQGAVPHWHGLRPDMHKSGSNKDEDDEPHGKKTHVLFSKDKQGVAASRADAVDFISLLEKKHQQAGIKSPEEDLILLLMRAGAELSSRKWLAPVTSALIVPPPLMGVEDPTVALKIANAVSFGLETSNGASTDKAVAFDYAFQPRWIDPSAKDMALSNGFSFSTPALAGVATALRLGTYRDLPAQDLSLKNAWVADLDLALNLWLCADGVDVIKDASVEYNDPVFAAETSLDPQEAARFAAVWMTGKHVDHVFDAITQKHKQLTRLEWDTMRAHAQGLPDFPAGLQTKCRPFQWYVQEVNTELNTEERASKEQPLNDVQARKEVETKVAAHKEMQKEEPKAPEKPKEPKTPEKPKEANMEQNFNLPDKPLEVPKVEEVQDEHLPGRIEQRKPQKPLDEARLELIQKAQPVDIRYEDVTGGHQEHPHKGARDANGNWGYVHDETALRKNPPKFDYPEIKQGCGNHDNHYKMLTEQVFVDLESHNAAQQSGKKRDKIFCLVYTIDSGHNRIPYIRQTWGPKCDGFMVGSNKTDASIGAVDIPHEGPEEYNNIWQKVRSMWSYIYDNYYEKYDWFHIGGDDLYLIVENLRLYLESEEIQTAQNGGIFLPNGDENVQTPLFLGRRFAYMGDMNDIFNSGGSGYTMNKAALKTLVVNGFPNYFPHAHTFSEDTMAARVFRKFGVFPYDTKDENGSERYMPFMPGHHWGYRLPPDPSKDWYAKYSINIKFGKEHCSKRSVAFHYAKEQAQLRLHAILYGLCPK